MIIKNEEKWLENCLNSIKDFVDEIIIVDTGSIDKSKEIARKFTNNVYDFKWNDNFSDARNFSISKATKDWILYLDADEVIADIDKEKIKRIIELDEAESYFFNWRDYFNETEISGFISTKNDIYKESQVAVGFAISKVLRFFKNNKQYFFQGQIHETPLKSIKDNQDKVFDTDVVIHHYGSLDKNKLIQKKEHYIRLLEKRIKEEDFTEKSKDYVYFELAMELINIQKTNRAIEYLEKAIEINEAYVYLYNLASQYLAINNLEDAEKYFKKAILKSAEYDEKYNYQNPQQYNSYNPSIYLNLGVIYTEKQEYNKAIRFFEKSIKLNPGFANAYFNLGIVYRLTGKLNKVEQLFEKAIELNPIFREKVDNL
tara:strand:- start:1365 stop:2477 length:1113 start_codon:yes stop_codon:yes gene_type:complete